ncbi:MAG: SsrA-binding protein SmpB [Chloroflexota bacterium]|nr:SsrA-binding protein SmpB [Chloroflexota bacterium]
MAKTDTTAEGRAITVNRKALHDYFIEETYEAGVALTGSEIKSVRRGKINLRDSYARIERGEVWLHQCHISPYEETGTYFNHDPLRPRKLLLHRSEIDRLVGQVQAKGLTLVPLRLYLKAGRAKIELAVARGKRSYDKREAIAEREAQREIERTLKSRSR